MKSAIDLITGRLEQVKRDKEWVIQRAENAREEIKQAQATIEKRDAEAVLLYAEQLELEAALDLLEHASLGPDSPPLHPGDAS